MGIYDWYLVRDVNSYIWTEYTEYENRTKVTSFYTQLSVFRYEVGGYLIVTLRNRNQNEEKKFLRIDNETMHKTDNVTFFYLNYQPLYSFGFWKVNEGEIIYLALSKLTRRVLDSLDSF